MIHNATRDQLLLAGPYKTKNSASDFGADPLRHMNQRCNIPDAGELKGINDQGSTRERKDTRMPRIQATRDYIKARMPIIVRQMSFTKKDTQDFNFSGKVLSLTHQARRRYPHPHGIFDDKQGNQAKKRKSSVTLNNVNNNEGKCRGYGTCLSATKSGD